MVYRNNAWTPGRDVGGRRTLMASETRGLRTNGASTVGRVKTRPVADSGAGIGCHAVKANGSALCSETVVSEPSASRRMTRTRGFEGSMAVLYRLRSASVLRANSVAAPTVFNGFGNTADHSHGSPSHRQTHPCTTYPTAIFRLVMLEHGHGVGLSASAPTHFGPTHTHPEICNSVPSGTICPFQYNLIPIEQLRLGMRLTAPQ